MAPGTSESVRDRVVELRRVPAAELRANPKNWRRHPQGQVRALTSVLQQVGYADALLARETPEGLELIDGHLRAEITPEQEVPVLVLDVDQEEADLILATLDPLAAMAEADGEALEALLSSVAIDSEDLAEYLAGQTGNGRKEGLTDPDEVPLPPKNSVSKLGDLWLCGEHRIACGDAFDQDALRRLLGNATPGCLLTDPPYGIDLDTDYRKMGPGVSQQVPKGQTPKTYRPVAGDARPFDAAPIRAFFSTVKEQFWFGANYYRRTLTENDLDGSWLVWDKRKEGADAFAGSGFELIWSAVPHKQDILRFFWFGMFGSPEARERMHPTQKPTLLIADILDRWSPARCVVADTFVGSGSTLIACENTGRRCYGMDIDPHYCDVAVRRWENFTGKTAELVT